MSARAYGLGVAALLHACTPSGAVTEPSEATGSTTEALAGDTTDAVPPDDTTSTDGPDPSPTTAAPDESTSSDDGTTSEDTTEGTTATDPVQEAIDHGIEGALALSEEDPVLLLLLDVMYRRHGIEAFAFAAARYDEVMGALPELPVDAIAFRRLFDPTQTFTAEQLAQIAPGVNEVTVPALFCDQLPLAPEYADRLVTDAALGGYELTHVTIALSWMDELGCPSPVDAAFREQVSASTFALVLPEDGLGDLELEAASFGSMLSGPAPLPPGVVDATVAGQLPDGTWPRNPGDAQGAWHATGLALLLLLDLHHEPQSPFVAPS